MTGQRIPNELLAPILQYSSWTWSKSQQLQIMLLSSAAFEFWVFYYDIIIHDSNDGSTLVYLVEAMNRLGSKYFAHRVRALWIDIAPSSAQVDSDDAPAHFFGAEWVMVGRSLEAIFLACRNIRHLRLNAQTHLDTLIQSALALRKLQSLCLSRSFHDLEFSDSASWPALLSGYPTPAFTSITHLTIEYLENDLTIRPSLVYIPFFKNVTHFCIHITASVYPSIQLLSTAFYSLPLLSTVVVLDRSTLEEWSHSPSRWYKHPWAWRNGIRLYIYGTTARVVPDEPRFGSVDEWRSVALASRFPALAANSVWRRQEHPRPLNWVDPQLEFV